MGEGSVIEEGLVGDEFIEDNLLANEAPGPAGLLPGNAEDPWISLFAVTALFFLNWEPHKTIFIWPTRSLHGCLFILCTMFVSIRFVCFNLLYISDWFFI